MPGVFLNEDDYNLDIALRRLKKKAAARKRLLKKMRKMNAA